MKLALNFIIVFAAAFLGTILGHKFMQEKGNRIVSGNVIAPTSDATVAPLIASSDKDICSEDIKRYCSMESSEMLKHICMERSVKKLTPNCADVVAKRRLALRPCEKDLQKICGEVEQVPTVQQDCLKSNIDKLSAACKVIVEI